MKTIEEKAKAYDEALERARKFYDNEQTRVGLTPIDLESIFPELKESEGGKIRKWLIEYFGKINDEIDIQDRGKIISWLEKQGTPTDINPSEFDLRLNKLLKQFETLPKEELVNCLSFYLNTVQNDGIYKRAENPADKVEPKFKAGDWITDDEDEAIFHITSYDIDYGYQIETVNGTSFHYSDETIEKKYRLWTIADAKDGDALRVNYLTFLFREVTDNNCQHKNAAVAYCSYVDGDDSFGLSGPDCITNLESIHPVTKEQRNILFQKMHEAGYEWDAEKKELKKVEQKPSAWGKEDDIMVRDILGWLPAKSRLEYNQRRVDWLKSLKERCTWKPSDEQMKQLGWIAEQNKDNMIGKELISLYQDLRKLREE